MTQFDINSYNEKDIENALIKIVANSKANMLDSTSSDGPAVYTEFTDDKNRFACLISIDSIWESANVISYISEIPKDASDNLIPIILLAVSDSNKNKDYNELKSTFKKIIEDYKEYENFDQLEISNFCTLFNDYFKDINSFDIYENDLAIESINQSIKTNFLIQSNVLSDIDNLPDMVFIDNKKEEPKAQPSFLTQEEIDVCETLERIWRRDSGHYEIDGLVFNSDCDTLIESKLEGYTAIELPSGIRCIQDHAFWRKHSAVSIKLPESLEYIGEEAFEGCMFLRSMHLNEGLRHVGKNAFSKCADLKAVYIPSTLTEIERNAFLINAWGNYPLEKIEISKNNPKYSDMDCDIIYDKKTDALVQSCSTSTIPDETKILEDCSLLPLDAEEITLYNVNKIKNYVFNSKLKRLIIKSDVYNISNDAFINCTGLEEIYFEGKMNTDLQLNLSNCKNLKSIYMSHLNKYSYFYEEHSDIIKPYTLIDKLNMQSTSFSELNKLFEETSANKEEDKTTR